MSLEEQLYSRRDTHQPIIVGWVGAGEFGTGMQLCAHDIPGLYPAVIADLHLKNAINSFLAAGRASEDIVIAETLVEVDEALADGKAVVTCSKELVFENNSVEVVVESSGVAEVAAQVIEGAIANRKHIVVVSIEVDCTVGTLLRQKADQQGVVYTIADGDQPGNIAELVAWARALGLEVVVAGKGTHYWPNHEGQIERAYRGRQDREFADGTKSAVELCSTCNCTGLTIDTHGPQWPAITLEDLPNFFRPRAEGGQLDTLGIVDAVDCVPANLIGTTDSRLDKGTFIIVRLENEAKRKYLAHYFSAASEDGRYGVIYRPHHLCGADANMSVIKAALCGEATGAPRDVRMCEVVAIAKRDLDAGETLHGMGSMDIRGIIIRHEEAMSKNLLPAAMAEDVELLVAVREGTPITYAMVRPPQNSTLWRLRIEQDRESLSY